MSEIIIEIAALLPVTIKNLFTKKIFISYSMRKAKIFKQIRHEYLKDKIIGYYYFQSFLGFSLPKNQIDFILNSKDAYSILKIIKNSNGKYTFDGKNFKSTIKESQTILACITYLICSMALMFYVLFYSEIRKYMSLKSYIICLIPLFVFFMPILINSIADILAARDAKQLEKLTQKRNT